MRTAFRRDGTHLIGDPQTVVVVVVAGYLERRNGQAHVAR